MSPLESPLLLPMVAGEGAVGGDEWDIGGGWFQLERGGSSIYPNPELLSSWSKVTAVLLK